jgi:hypothetical protein
MLDNSTASRVLSVVYATKAITKIIYDRVLSVVYATKAITKIIYRIALGRSRRRAQWPRTRHSDELFNELERSSQRKRAPADHRAVNRHQPWRCHH